MRAVLFAINGAAIGIAIGYAVFVFSNGIAYKFVDWLFDPDLDQDALLWGALI